MQLSYLLTVAIATTAFALPNVKRDGAQIVSDLGVVDTKVKALDASIASYNGGSSGLSQALQIQQKSSDVLKQLQATTTDAQNSQPLTEDESYAVANAVNDLTPDVTTTLDHLEAKKAQFQGNGLTSVVLGQLKDQRAATVSLSGAIVEKVPSDLQQAAGQFVQPILDKFDEAIKTFSS